ncbi:MAG: S41 family peptidase [Candidatus Acidiferrales bacterium]
MAASFAVVTGLVCAGHALGQQTISKGEQEQARAVLQKVEAEIEKDYYDPKLNGYDLRARFAEAQKKAADATTTGEELGIIDWAIEGLSDSHTYFGLFHTVIEDPGWRMEMVGDKCLFFAVNPDSDAWEQGIRPGDQVLKVEGYQPTRATFLTILRRLTDFPRRETKFTVAAPGQSSREVIAKNHEIQLGRTYASNKDTQIQFQHIRKEMERASKPKVVDANDKLMILKVSRLDLKHEEIDPLIGSAKKHDTLILDLRDNRGGWDTPLDPIIGCFFDHDIDAGETVVRKGKKPAHIPSWGNHAFTGRLFVLINSRTASGAEVLARIVQIEKRGTLMGDQTAGEVGVAENHGFGEGLNLGNLFIFQVNITKERFLMPDGKDLEGIGVTPDIKIIPTQLDLANGRDPVLAAAMTLAGVPTEPEAAGKLFPSIWLAH